MGLGRYMLLKGSVSKRARFNGAKIGGSLIPGAAASPATGLIFPQNRPNICGRFAKPMKLARLPDMDATLAFEGSSKKTSILRSISPPKNARIFVVFKI